ncbi:hypothetical protein DSM106972_083860 [Dulcicalothrix desertica PCC 7102]|uniref:Uncharacterized protein n=1 Tax=Dulcicalothrix desertica PCC 7102 TaxID=232991 RepID=A0A3S1C6F3_9CYAN|nr:hypothetical protein DSM106972_083860 [Dulcicalothrix desertica PCC 7102]
MQITLAPRLANARAIYTPIPPEAPVNSTFRAAMFVIIISLTEAISKEILNLIANLTYVKIISVVEYTLLRQSNRNKV